MKLYAAADIHGSQYRLNIILKNLEKYSPDLVVICGDITQFGPGDVAKNFLNQIKTDTFAIPGNIDPPDVNQSITDSKAININLKKVIREKNTFVGIGGNLSNSLSEIIIEDKGSKIPLEKSIDESTILVTHVPPFKTQDRIFLGQHSGNKDLRMLVDKLKPKLVLCGHIHENPGFTNLGKTIVVNCSIGKSTEGVIIEINDKTDVKILD